MLDDLGRREVPVLLAAATGFRIFAFKFCSILFNSGELPWCRLRVVVGQGADRSSAPGPIRARATLLLNSVVLPPALPECTGQVPEPGYPPRDFLSLEFPRLLWTCQWHGPFLSRVPAGNS